MAPLTLGSLAPVAMVLALIGEQTPAQQQDEPRIIKTLIVSVGQTVPLQMTTKRPITQVVVDREDVVRVRPAQNDQSTVLITGLKPGRVLIKLTDDRGKTETFGPGKPPEKK